MQRVPVLILAGGLGTRISEETHMKPKPLIEIGGIPILLHIMRSYYAQGFDDFVILAGYRSWDIKELFLNYECRMNHLTIDHRSSQHQPAAVFGSNQNQEKWRVRIIDTGLNTQTGGRVARALDVLADCGDEFEDFAVTYGDGLCDVNLNTELIFHKEHRRVGTILGVPPLARFGELDFDDGKRVKRFLEKPRIQSSLINGGFFFFNKGFREYLSADESCILERKPLEDLARSEQLVMYEHRGFWHCMDTLRDKLYLQELWDSGQPPWQQVYGD
jgi:glucose-1-phosphate cytidylyltransferase